MKSNYRYIVKAFMAMAVIAGTTSCDDFLDREPMSSISPETYYSTAAQLEANLNDEYPNVLPSFGQWTYGIFGEDKGTDNQIEVNANDRYTQDRWKVPHSESDNWKFERIYRINFFLSEALPKFGEDMSGSQNTISGSVATIKHYIGEMYFLRAYEYFKSFSCSVTSRLSTNRLPMRWKLSVKPANVFRVMKWHVSSFPILTRLMPI